MSRFELARICAAHFEQIPAVISLSVCARSAGVFLCLLMSADKLAAPPLKCTQAELFLRNSDVAGGLLCVCMALFIGVSKLSSKHIFECTIIYYLLEI